ncbi:TIGR02679 domain-containing protein [Kineosporia babensis]|uniref:TIGR02679 domain-containing protein n=1 Tax=Kineosporia babensis TaxID=499548 RepID=A0A9X1SY04_9ACTN|nr:TIGR02679 domain-containing protein [Kineosporia babensis]MCD5315790.1 TIGR02679 domain-containing protein [Kineosporia babensis]
MPADIQRLAADPDLLPLWQAVHDRLASGSKSTELATIRIRSLNRAGISVLRSYLDTTPRHRRGSSSVRVKAGDTVVSLRELLDRFELSPEVLPSLVVQAVGRPIVDRSEAARQARSLRDEVWDFARQRLHRVPGLVASMRSAGFGEDEAPTRRQIDALGEILDQVPIRRKVSLAKLSHDVAQDPHYFDLDTLAGKRLVLAVAEALAVEAPERPDLVRSLLGKAGIIGDRFSATVLVMNAETTGSGVIDRRLREAVGPVSLNLFDLTETPPTFARQTLTVVENPSVIEQAVQQGIKRPLACTSGQLRAVDHVLLGLARDCQVDLQYAGDLDVHGRQIAAVVSGLYSAKIIAMDEDDLCGDNAESISSDPVIYQEHDACLRQIFGQAD